MPAKRLNVRSVEIQPYETPINSYVGQVGEATALGVDTYSENPYDCTFSGVPQSAVGAYAWSDALGIYVGVQLSVDDNILFLYATAPWTGVLSATCSVGSNTVTFPDLPVSFTAPVGASTNSYGTIAINNNYGNYPYEAIHWGTPQAPGVKWAYTAAGDDAGQIGVFQLVRSTVTGPGLVDVDTRANYCADTNIPYSDGLHPQWVNTGSVSSNIDAPAIEMGQNVAANRGTFTWDSAFADYFMYLSSTENGGVASIPVTLRKAVWEWAGSVDRKAGGNTWLSGPLTTEGPGATDYELPYWNCNITEY